MQAQQETLQIVQSTIAKQLSVDESTVTSETKFADLGADSLDTVRPQIDHTLVNVSFCVESAFLRVLVCTVCTIERRLKL